MEIHFSAMTATAVPPVLLASGGGGVDVGLVAETILWILALIAFIILGLAILMKIRREEKDARAGSLAGEGQVDRFRALYEKNLITFDEFQTIKKNLRDRLVYDVLHRENTEAGNGRKTSGLGKKRGRSDGFFPEDDEKERRLKSLLEGMKESE